MKDARFPRHLNEFTKGYLRANTYQFECIHTYELIFVTEPFFNQRADTNTFLFASKNMLKGEHVPLPKDSILASMSALALATLSTDTTALKLFSAA